MHRSIITYKLLVQYYYIMNTKTSVVFGIITIAAAVLLFAAGSVVATYQAWACGGWGGGWRPHFYGGFGNGPSSSVGYGGNGPSSSVGYGGNGPSSSVGYGGNAY
jgi:hypothetical protein